MKVIEEVDIDYLLNNGICEEEDIPVLFPEGRGSRDAEVGKALCSMCPVREECLEYALENSITFGIWGGHTYRDRINLQREREGKTEWRFLDEQEAESIFV